MIDLQPLTKLAVSISYVLVGVLMRRLSIWQPIHARAALRGAIFVTLPASLLLEFNAATDLTVGAQLAGVAFIYNICMLVGGFFAFRNWRPSSRAAMVAMLLGWNVANFAHPFVAALWGHEALRSSIAIDVANCLVTFVMSYVVFFSARSDGMKPGKLIRRIATFPPLVAVYVSLLLHAMQVSLPLVVTTTLAPVAKANAPLILVALGVLFEITAQPRQAAALNAVLTLRYGIGLLVGAVLAATLPLPYPAPLVLQVVLACPVPAVYIDYAAAAEKRNVSLVSLAVNMTNVASLAIVVLFAVIPQHLTPMVGAVLGCSVLAHGLPGFLEAAKPPAVVLPMAVETEESFDPASPQLAVPVSAVLPALEPAASAPSKEMESGGGQRGGSIEAGVVQRHRRHSPARHGGRMCGRIGRRGLLPHRGGGTAGPARSARSWL
ncbi:hypothetical protein PPROV_001016200 [Pycnococcus provasolii]|uniref:Auxin efflux carrier component n=1 Tax=Pycnococcus provasolii TaxID=41880 RepID=A0A830HW25_9CHLO|nr:hypothetical protein PPROV_001016200 [Pycnococcus provasolii]|mmetsp:Transcript_7984/g.20975  ORF Transcript_7984/g.20975 Transcript_7984/m.20975 type:complete len:436 (+) Transcript_7984:893-2200(+)